MAISSPIDRTYVDARIRDWKGRLENLCDEIQQWCEKLGYQYHREMMLQRQEEIMRDYGVEPVELPAITVTNGKRTVEFFPSALWVAGSNGRVNAMAEKRQHVMLDVGGVMGAPSNWQILSSSLSIHFVPFNEKVLIELLEKGEIAA